MTLMFRNDKSINIMHISDIHCGIDDKKSPKYRRERKDAIDAFYRDIVNIPIDWRPHIIAITGDIGWTGCSQDYKEFEKFLEKLLEATNLNPEDVICCPGNHDKYLPLNQKFPSSIKGISNYYSIDDVWNNIKPLACNFTNYSKELKNMGIKPLSNNSSLENTKYLYGYQVINGLCFIVLNSAWLCDWREDRKCLNADKNNLLIDGNIVLEILENELPMMPIIVMFHHPSEWLKSKEKSHPYSVPTTIDYINEKANIILNGHTHEPQNEHFRNRLHYIAGTISSDDTYKSECYLLKIFINKDDVKLSTVIEGRYFAEWDNKKVFWRFEKNSASQYFDMQAAIDSLTEEKNNKSERTFKLLDFMENSKDEYGTYEQFFKYMNKLKQEYMDRNEQYEKIRLKVSDLEKQLTTNANINEEIAKYKEKSISVLEEVLSCLEINLTEMQNFLENLWEFILDSTLSDVEKNEQIKRLIKIDPFGGKIIIESDDN